SDPGSKPEADRPVRPQRSPPQKDEQDSAGHITPGHQPGTEGNMHLRRSPYTTATGRVYPQRFIEVAEIKRRKDHPESKQDEPPVDPECLPVMHVKLLVPGFRVRLTVTVVSMVFLVVLIQCVLGHWTCYATASH